nr:hypothetical protein HJG59_010021 [Molossus molossus]
MLSVTTLTSKPWFSPPFPCVLQSGSASSHVKGEVTPPSPRSREDEGLKERVVPSGHLVAPSEQLAWL